FIKDELIVFSDISLQRFSLPHYSYYQFLLIHDTNPIEELTIGNTIKYLDTLQKDRKSTRLNSSHVSTSYAVFCLKKKTAAAELLADCRQRTGQSRGRVIAKWALSLDGRLAAADDTSQWITSAKSRSHDHMQRTVA